MKKSHTGNRAFLSSLALVTSTLIGVSVASQQANATPLPAPFRIAAASQEEPPRVENGRIVKIGSIDSLDDQSTVRVSGKVESVSSAQAFTLNDGTGSIQVEVGTGQSVSFKKGDAVNVSGVLNKGPLERTTITANADDVHTDLAKTIGNDVKKGVASVKKGIESVVGSNDAPPASSISDTAQSSNIKDIPEKGLVKVSGTVTDVNDKSFSIKDGTDSIEVKTSAEKAASLTEGSNVTVVGNVSSTLLGKNLEARTVVVNSR